MLIARLFWVVGFMIVLDMIYGVVGLLLCRLDPVKHSKLYRAGLRSLAMCLTFGSKRIVECCRLDCPAENCGNWTCPKYGDPARRR